MSKPTIPTLGVTQLQDTTVKIIQSDQIPQQTPPPPVLISKAIPPQVNTSSIVQPRLVQDVRVDNWGNYCLQRLQAMYERSEFCDLILQFHNLQVIKVHRIVVNLCTDYFANLERFFGLSNGMLVLPKDIEFTSMLVIIKFFYTGKLEVRGAQSSDIYRIVKLMNVNILIKLLEAHAKKADENPPKTSSGQVVLKSSGTQALKSFQVRSGLNAGQFPVGMRKKLTVTRPLPPGMKTKTVLARVQQQTLRVLPKSIKATSIAPKKLPIWKERKTIIQSSNIMHRCAPQKEEPARPTRFEWPEPEDESGVFRLVQNLQGQEEIPAVSSLSQTPSEVFDAVKSQVQDISPQLLKHKLPADTDSEFEACKSKMAKLNDDIEKELAAMEEVSGNVDNEDSCGHDSAIEGPFCQEISETTEVASAVEISSTEPEFQETERNTTGIVSALKAFPSKKVIKTVRFAPEVGKENAEIEKELPGLSFPQSTSVAPVVDCVATVKEDQPANHSKIISEVLKKYPELVKDNKSIKLKIVQKGPPEAGAKEGKSKISYIVLKSSSSTDSLGSVVLKKFLSPTKSKFWEPENSTRKVSSAAENTGGPWICVPCGSGETPEHFDSYYNYRKHLVEVHGEKVDARICEHCGYKASKRNLLLHHLYTKHAVPPPTNYSFPHCDRCDYVALSESLLNKHKIAHNSAKEFSCTICRASFKSNAALQGHMTANLHRNRDSKEYQCPYCQRQFARNINLKSHIRCVHKDVAQVEELEDSFPISDDMVSHENKDLQYHSVEHGQLIEVDGLTTSDEHHVEVIHEIGGSLTVPLSIIPSSEAEALNNVASSIAASLGLGAQVHQTGEGYPEHIVGEGTQVYVLNNPASDVEMAGVELSADGTMLLSNVDNIDDEGQFLVQDIHGNKFRKLTGRDSDGNSVVFFQLTDDIEHVPMTPMLDESVSITQEVPSMDSHVDYEFDGKSSISVQNDHMYLDPQKCSVFVTDGGMPVPVTIRSESEELDQGQTLVTYSGDGSHVIELVPLTAVETMEMDEHHETMKALEESEHMETVVENPSNHDVNELSYPINSGTPQEVILEEIDYEDEQKEELVETDVSDNTTSLTMDVVDEQLSLESTED